VTGQPFVGHWLHVGLVGLGGEKMSKSLGNLIFVGDLLKDWDADAIRLAVLVHHYRSDWEWHGADIVDAQTRLERWRHSAALPATPTSPSTRCASASTTTSTRPGRSAPRRGGDTGQPVRAGAALLGVTL